jgi:hypothetical protein
MKSKWTWFAGLVALAAVAVSCGGSEVTGPPKEQITGVWHATRIQYVSTGALGTVDLVTSGATARLALGADSTFRYTLQRVGADSAVTTGRWVLGTDGVLTLTPAGSAWGWTWTAALDAGALSLTGASAEYDFNSDGVMDPARWNLSFIR